MQIEEDREELFCFVTCNVEGILNLWGYEFVNFVCLCICVFIFIVFITIDCIEKLNYSLHHCFVFF